MQRRLSRLDHNVSVQQGKVTTLAVAQTAKSLHVVEAKIGKYRAQVMEAAEHLASCVPGSAEAADAEKVLELASAHVRALESIETNSKKAAHDVEEAAKDIKQRRRRSTLMGAALQNVRSIAVTKEREVKQANTELNNLRSALASLPEGEGNEEVQQELEEKLTKARDDSAEAEMARQAAVGKKKTLLKAKRVHDRKTRRKVRKTLNQVAKAKTQKAKALKAKRSAKAAKAAKVGTNAVGNADGNADGNASSAEETSGGDDAGEEKGSGDEGNGVDTIEEPGVSAAAAVHIAAMQESLMDQLRAELREEIQMKHDALHGKIEDTSRQVVGMASTLSRTELLAHAAAKSRSTKLVAEWEKEEVQHWFELCGITGPTCQTFMSAHHLGIGSALVGVSAEAFKFALLSSDGLSAAVVERAVKAKHQLDELHATQLATHLAATHATCTARERSRDVWGDC